MPTLPKNNQEEPISPKHILVVDDEPIQRKLLTQWLRKDGYCVESVEDGESCLQALQTFPAEVVLLDFHMPKLNGLEVLQRLKDSNPYLPVIMVTYEQTTQTIVQVMQAGAYDYLPKPVDRLKLKTIIPRAMAQFQQALEGLELHRSRTDTHGYGDIVSQAEAMKPLFCYLDRLAHSDISVLIHGESGTGKELIAQAIHANGWRAQKGEMVAVNCGAIAPTLQESLFFGHEKGAFTGADKAHTGHIERAHKGTLFLDEVAELCAPLQAALLRVLQESSFRRLGGSTLIDVDIRVIAASHKDLKQEVNAGRFREDLYYRLAIFDLEVPALRERPEDIPLLAHHFLQKHQSTPPITTIEDDALEMLMSYPWPGNIRELSNAMERAALLSDTDKLTHAALPHSITSHTSTHDQGSQDRSTQRVIPLAELERRAILHAWEVTQGNMSLMSRLLGISRATLYRKMKPYDLQLDEP